MRDSQEKAGAACQNEYWEQPQDVSSLPTSCSGITWQEGTNGKLLKLMQLSAFCRIAKISSSSFTTHHGRCWETKFSIAQASAVKHKSDMIDQAAFVTGEDFRSKIFCQFQSKLMAILPTDVVTLLSISSLTWA